MPLSSVQFRDLSQLVRDNPKASATALGLSLLIFVCSTTSAWNSFSNLLGVPSCLIYGTTYYYSGGYFHELTDAWVQHGDATEKFEELARDRNYITLRKKQSAEANAQAMTIRIPVCGGKVQWRYDDPQRWIDLYEVWR